MKRKTHGRGKRLLWQAFAGLLLAAVPLALGGCLTGYGGLRPSGQASRVFGEGVLLPNHTYYYHGPEAIPWAIIAIDNKYVLETRLWIQVQPTSEQLKEWAVLMTGAPGGPPPLGYGSELVTASGEVAGLWYSRWDRTIVKMIGSNGIRVTPPVQEETPLGKRKPRLDEIGPSAFPAVP